MKNDAGPRDPMRQLCASLRVFHSGGNDAGDAWVMISKLPTGSAIAREVDAANAGAPSASLISSQRKSGANPEGNVGSLYRVVDRSTAPNASAPTGVDD